MMNKEWIETNGLGSAISGTVSLANTRKYHALLTGLDTFGRRQTYVNNIEVYFEKSDGKKVALSSNIYSNNIIFPRGLDTIEEFHSYPWPTWKLKVGENQYILREIISIYNSEQTLIKFTGINIQGGRLIIRPLVSGRSYFDVKKDYQNLPKISFKHNGDWSAVGLWFYNNRYPKTKSRGEDDLEHLWSPGEITYSINDKQSSYLLMSVKERVDEIDFAKIVSDEQRRRAQIYNRIDTEDMNLKQIALKSEDYLFSRPDGQRSILAGFPWFLDWGRDTFISLEGLLMIKGRIDEAHQILKTFASFENKGLIPNMFPSFGETPIYNSVDAPLHFIRAAGKSIDYGNSIESVRRDLFPAIKNIINNYIQGTLFNIHVDENDGLVYAGAINEQLTWMDAKVEDFVITPRRGCPVEINALWYNALKVAINIAKKDDSDVDKWKKFKNMIADNFENKFLDNQRGYLRDVVRADDTNDQLKIRPNALYALAYASELLSVKNSKRALDTIERELLTPYGLRSLSEGDLDYIGLYVGDRFERDASYHQGTVWSFLIGVYVDAVLKIHGRSEEDRLWKYLSNLKQHSDQYSNGHISEIFDGNAPHEPKGCFAQAWSDAEFIRAAFILGKLNFK